MDFICCYSKKFDEIKKLYEKHLPIVLEFVDVERKQIKRSKWRRIDGAKSDHLENYITIADESPWGNIASVTVELVDVRGQKNERIDDA